MEKWLQLYGLEAPRSNYIQMWQRNVKSWPRNVKSWPNTAKNWPSRASNWSIKPKNLPSNVNDRPIKLKKIAQKHNE